MSCKRNLLRFEESANKNEELKKKVRDRPVNSLLLCLCGIDSSGSIISVIFQISSRDSPPRDDKLVMSLFESFGTIFSFDGGDIWRCRRLCSSETHWCIEWILYWSRLVVVVDPWRSTNGGANETYLPFGCFRIGLWPFQEGKLQSWL